MKRGMSAHALMAQRPVDAGDHPGARAGQGRAFGGHMQNGRPVGVVDRAHDRDGHPVLEHQRALVAALPSALGIENRAVERDAARLRGEHDRFRLGPVGVLAKEGFSHCTNT